MRTSVTKGNQPQKNKGRFCCIAAGLCVVMIVGGYFLVKSLTDTTNQNPADSAQSYDFDSFTPSEAVSNEISHDTGMSAVSDSIELPQITTAGESGTMTESGDGADPVESEDNTLASGSESEHIDSSDTSSIQQTERVIPETTPDTVQDTTPDTATDATTSSTTDADTSAGNSSSNSASPTLSDDIVYLEIGPDTGRPLSDYFN